MSYDLKITGGTIVDGTGKSGFSGALGIKDGKVVALGKVDGPAAATIDATGKVVAPGFVDVHTHYDAQILWDRMLTISPWHGITTTVIGNCGFGVAPTKAIHRKLIMQTLEKVEGMSLDALHAGLGDDWPFETFPQYLDALEKRGSAINVAALFGHTPLRMYVMGEESTERAATADEIDAMKKLMREAVRRSRHLDCAPLLPLRPGWASQAARPRRRATQVGCAGHPAGELPAAQLRVHLRRAVHL